MEISDDKACVFTNGLLVNILKNELFLEYSF
jgi:hypothetical protein